ncbi:MAG: hypothetical protein AAB473_03525 [Patescibacteria group bacterium]
MLSKNDIQVLRDMFRENNATFKLEMREEMLDLIVASEKRIIADVVGRIAVAEERIIGEVTDFIGSSILPQIDEHNMRIGRLERHTMLIA